jgi:hypothetical protein
MIIRVPDQLSSAYAAFRRERRPDDVLHPGHLSLPSFREPAFALNPDLSRAVRAADGTTAYLVPGDGVLAVIDRGGGGVAGLHQALDGTILGTSFRGTGRLQVLGVVPDGVREVVIERRNGDMISEPVNDHLYAVVVVATTPDELPDRVHLKLGDHERHLRVPGADDEVLTLRSPRDPRPEDA